MHGTADIASLQFFCPAIAAQSGAFGVEAEHIEMPGMLDFGPRGRQLQFRHGGETPVVAFDDELAAMMKFLEALQLAQTERCLDIGHVAFESRAHDLIEPTAPRSVALPCIA